MVLHVGLEVSGQQPHKRSGVGRVAAYWDRLEHEEHAAREVCVAVLVASDLAAQVIEPYLLAEDLLGARRTTAEKLSDRVDRRARVLTRWSLEHDHEIVVALAGHLVTAPRAHQNDGRVPIGLKLCNSLSTFDQAAFGQIASSPDAAEPNAGSNFQASDAAHLGHDGYAVSVLPLAIRRGERSSPSQRSGGAASSIHGTSRHRSRTAANRSSSSSVRGT
jgi:hypothetical protein